jgi:hypothetical protein
MPNSVDAAFARYQVLVGILDRGRRRALSNPTDQANVDLGLVQRGLKRSEAEAAIEAVFEELSGFLDHVCILDMAAAFELQCRAWLGTAVGEARKAIGRGYGKHIPLYLSRESLIRRIDDFEGLAEIEVLVTGQLTIETADKLKDVRSNRNKFSHGTDTNVPPTITIQEAKETLDAAIKAILA